MVMLEKMLLVSKESMVGHGYGEHNPEGTRILELCTPADLGFNNHPLGPATKRKMWKLKSPEVSELFKNSVYSSAVFQTPSRC